MFKFIAKYKALSATLTFIIAVMVVTVAMKYSQKTNQSAVQVTEKPSKAEQKKKNNIKVFVIGRSFVTTWLSTFGGSATKPVKKDQYTLYQKNVDAPPNLVECAVKTCSKGADKNTVILFILDFEDFKGGSKEAADKNLKRNQDIILEIVENLVVKRKLKVLIANALPRAQKNSDKYLVANQKAYNNWLEELLKKHKNAGIFNIYDKTADYNGNLLTVIEDFDGFDVSDQEGLDNLSTPGKKFTEMLATDIYSSWKQ